MLKSLNTAFINSLDGQKFSGSKESISINNKIISVNKSSLVINKENTNSILENLEHNLKNDTRFINDYSYIFNTKPTETKYEITRQLNNLNF